MDGITDAMTGLVQELFSLDRWPFLSAVLVMTIIGQVMSSSVFTREHAYRQRRGQWFWYWGRETLPLHPIASGFALGFLWQDPEGAGWPLVASCMYFGTAGVLSLIAWQVVKGLAKKRGVRLTLPGGSVPPPKGE